MTGTSVTNYIKDTYLNLYSVSEGLVNDPFRDTEDQYYLWRDPAKKNWLWLNSTSGDVVYMQKESTKTKTQVFLFPQGFSLNGVSSYDFTLFNCMK